jgi:ribosomal protein S18 acetylase RimI-like enzyme
MDKAEQIRSYEPRDRAGLRQICCDTADAGQSVEHFFPDREVFADLLTNYYTEWEPQSVFVADNDGEVAGYVTGCMDTNRFLRVMASCIVPVVLIKALFRGVLWHPQTVRLLRTNVSLWLKNGYRHGAALDGYPAHLHVNVRQSCRGRRLGQRLVEIFCERAQTGGVRGVHAGVSDGNSRARHFFEELGFVELRREPRLCSPDGSGRVFYTIIYGKRLCTSGNVS